MTAPSKIPPARLSSAIAMLCSGLRHAHVQHALQEGFAVSLRTAQYTITRAYEVLAEEEAAERPHRKRQLRHYLWRIARKAEAKYDYGAAVAAVRQLMRLDGLEAPRKLEVDAKVEHAAKPLADLRALPTEERRLMRQLLDMHTPEAVMDTPAEYAVLGLCPFCHCADVVPVTQRGQRRIECLRCRGSWAEVRRVCGYRDFRSAQEQAMDRASEWYRQRVLGPGSASRA